MELTSWWTLLTYPKRYITGFISWRYEAFEETVVSGDPFKSFKQVRAIVLYLQLQTSAIHSNYDANKLDPGDQHEWKISRKL